MAADGSLDITYAQKRSTSMALKYRLKRRTKEVIDCIKRNFDIDNNGNLKIIDLGCADGRMLSVIKAALPESECTGVEFSQDLVDYAKASFPEINIMQGNIEEKVFENEQFNVAVATAVIEHLERPESFLRKVESILSPGGILIITTPVPFWEKIASNVGHIEKDKHHSVMAIRELSLLGAKAGFEVLEKKKFMLSPVGLPFENILEKALRKIKFTFFMVNQLIVLKKSTKK